MLFRSKKQTDARQVKQKPLPLVINKDCYIREGDRNVVRPEYRKAWYERALRLAQNIVDSIKEDARAGFRVNEKSYKQDKKTLNYLKSINWWDLK